MVRVPSPPTCLPVSLAACTAYDVVEILRKQRQDLRGLEAVDHVDAGPDPPWTFRAIDIEWVVTGSVDHHKAERAVIDRRGEVLRRRGDDPAGRRPDPQRPDRARPETTGESAMDAASLPSARLADGPLLADGGMGTSLIDTGVPVDACMEALNEREPARVAGDPRGLRRRRRPARAHEHVRREPLPTRPARARRSRRARSARPGSRCARDAGARARRRLASARSACGSSRTAACPPRRRSTRTGSRRRRSPRPASTCS